MESVQELSAGNLLFYRSSVDMLQIVSPEGDLAWEARTALPTFSNDVHILPSVYETVTTGARLE